MSAPRACSGLMYSGVPQTSPACVSFGSFAPGEVIFAIPKSSTFTKSGSPRRGSTMTFSGFRSRCTIPCAWASARAERTCAAMRTMRASPSGDSSAIRRARSLPPRCSIAMNSVPSSASPKSSTWIEFGWSSREAARASRWNRCTTWGSLEYARCSIFSTTGRSSVRWRAR